MTTVIKRPTITNTSLPAAFGARWTEDSGTTFELAIVRGGTALQFGMRAEGSGGWTTFPVDAPERFTLGQPVSTQAEFNLVLDRWFADLHS